MNHSAADGARRRPRAGLPARIALGVLAAAAVIVAILAAVNLNAMATFNQATQSLNGNITAAGKEDADYAALQVRQEQTDDQFGQAASFDAVLLPRIRQAIEANTRTSAQLTQLINQRLQKQQNGSNSSDGGQSANQSDSSDGSADNDGGLTEQQRQQVEQLLESNGSSSTTTESSQQSTQSDTTNNSGNSAKPW